MCCSAGCPGFLGLCCLGGLAFHREVLVTPLRESRKETMATKRKAKRKTAKRKAGKVEAKPNVVGRMSLLKVELEDVIRNAIDERLDSYLYSTGPVTWHEDGGVTVDYERRQP